MAAGVKSLCKQIDELCWDNPKLAPIAIRLLRVTVATLNESTTHGMGTGKRVKRLPPLREAAKGKKKNAPHPVPPPEIPQQSTPGESVLQVISHRNDGLAPLLNSHNIRYTSSVLIRDETPRTPEIPPHAPQAFQNSQHDSSGVYHYNHQADHQTGSQTVSPTYVSGSEINTARLPLVPTPSAPVMQPLNHHHKHQVQIGIGGESSSPTAANRKPGFLRHLHEIRGGPSGEEIAERERKQKEWLQSLEEQIRENQERKRREHDQFVREERKWQERDPNYTVQSTAYDHRHIMSG